MKRMAYHLLAILILGMAASAVKAQILLTASATPIEEYAAVELQRYYYQLSGRLLSIDHEEVRGQENGICSDKTGSSVSEVLERQRSITSEVHAGRAGIYHSDSKRKRQGIGCHCRC